MNQTHLILGVVVHHQLLHETTHGEDFVALKTTSSSPAITVITIIFWGGRRYTRGGEKVATSSTGWQLMGCKLSLESMLYLRDSHGGEEGDANRSVAILVLVSAQTNQRRARDDITTCGLLAPCTEKQDTRTHSLPPSRTHSFTHTLLHSFTPSLLHTLTHSLTHTLTHTLTHSTHSHSLTHTHCNIAGGANLKMSTFTVMAREPRTPLRVS